MLILYSRAGCCLCEGLEQRLRSIPLQRLVPPQELHVIDIDSNEVSEELRANYDQQVPVIALWMEDTKKRVEFPRVSPRLNEEGLFLWVQKVISKSI